MFLRASRHATAFLRRSNAVSGSKASFAEHLAAKTAEKARFPAENQLDAPDEAAFGMKLPRFDRLEREKRDFGAHRGGCYRFLGLVGRFGGKNAAALRADVYASA